MHFENKGPDMEKYQHGLLSQTQNNLDGRAKEIMPCFANLTPNDRFHSRTKFILKYLDSP